RVPIAHLRQVLPSGLTAQRGQYRECHQRRSPNHRGWKLTLRPPLVEPPWWCHAPNFRSIRHCLLGAIYDAILRHAKTCEAVRLSSNCLEAQMRSTTAILLVLLAGAWNFSVAAQTPQPPAATARTVIAATKLASVVDEPLKFRALSVTLA